MKLGRTEEPAAAVHGEDSPGECGSVEEARKKEPCRCGGEAREGFQDGVELERVGDEASWRLGLSTTRRRRAGIVERIDSGS